MASFKGVLPSWIIIWFIATAVICTWDASFIVFRPHTLPGGSIHWVWTLYKFYITVDQRYLDQGDSYVFAQSLLNYLEVVMNIAAIVMHFKQSRHTNIMAFTVSVMTFWKTVLYILVFTEFCSGDVYRQGNSMMEEIFLVFIPNGVWLVIPFAVMVSLYDKLIPTNMDSYNGVTVDYQNRKKIH